MLTLSLVLVPAMNFCSSAQPASGLTWQVIAILPVTGVNGTLADTY